VEYAPLSPVLGRKTSAWTSHVWCAKLTSGKHVWLIFFSALSTQPMHVQFKVERGVGLCSDVLTLIMHNYTSL
jgi:hypothetical protein